MQAWCSSSATEAAPGADPVDAPASPDCASFAPAIGAAVGPSPVQPPIESLAALGALPMTPGGGIASPAARLLLSAMRPGWTQGSVAGVSTPYVEQLLRTLPLLTPETGRISALLRNLLVT